MVDSFSDFFIVPGYIPLLISMVLFPTRTYDGPLFFLMFKNIQIIIDDEVTSGNVIIIGFSGFLEYGSAIWWYYLNIEGDSNITIIF